MRFIALFSICLFISAYANAQLSEEGFRYLKKAEKFNRMKNTGRTLTLAGAALIAIGIVTLSNSTITTYSNGSTSTTGNPQAGALEFLLGNAAMGAGIPLWIIGGNNQKKYEKKMVLDRYSGSIDRSPFNAGVTLRLRF